MGAARAIKAVHGTVFTVRHVIFDSSFVNIIPDWTPLRDPVRRAGEHRRLHVRLCRDQICLCCPFAGHWNGPFSVFFHVNLMLILLTVWVLVASGMDSPCRRRDG